MSVSILHLYVLCGCFLFLTCDYYWTDNMEIENLWSYHMKFLCCHLSPHYLGTSSTVLHLLSSFCTCWLWLLHTCWSSWVLCILEELVWNAGYPFCLLFHGGNQTSFSSTTFAALFFCLFLLHQIFSFVAFLSAFWVICVSRLLTHANTCSLVTSLGLLYVIWKDLLWSKA